MRIVPRARQVGHTEDMGFAWVRKCGRVACSRAWRAVNFCNALFGCAGSPLRQKSPAEAGLKWNTDNYEEGPSWIHSPRWDCENDENVAFHERRIGFCVGLPAII